MSGGWRTIAKARMDARLRSLVTGAPTAVARGDALRLAAPLVLLAAVSLLVAARVVLLEVAYGDDYRELASQPVERTHRLPGRRGAIATRDGVVLAYDVPTLVLEMHYRAFEEPPDAAWFCVARHISKSWGAWLSTSSVLKV